ncbi:hypothetical protein [Macrococcoides bohemicum]|uniref:hypothetical protein n=1 Tax=Macrococcoides bohemicum TaxID=1903056 RepID=UPI00165E50D7|nr:hypothetical protein [Macrococcus bohemicus]MBC9875654.1 hypothetical protein [Macrococcus bohemicus]
MNNKLFFYVYLFLVAFLSINVFKHISQGAPPADYLIYAIIALTFMGLIIDDLIELFYGKSSLLVSTIFNIIIYIAILIVSIFAMKYGANTLDIILYLLFIIISILMIVVTIVKYRRNNITKS